MKLVPLICSISGKVLKYRSFGLINKDTRFSYLYLWQSSPVLCLSSVIYPIDFCKLDTHTILPACSGSSQLDLHMSLTFLSNTLLAYNIIRLHYSHLHEQPNELIAT